MNAEQLLMREGAYYFGNRLIFRNQDIGLKSGSGLALNEKGQELANKLADVTDVEPKKPIAKRAKRTVVESPVDLGEPVEQSLDELLGD